MLLVLPTTSTIRPASYLAPQPYEYHPSYDYYPHYDAPRFSAPSYPSHLDFFHQPSAEELEEHEYRQALEVVANHRRRQAEKEAVIRRHQVAEAARRRYTAILAAELEQRRQEELLAARRAELLHSQEARARLAAAGRHHALGAFLRDLKGPQPTFCQAHAAKCRSLADVLNQRVPSEFDTDITGPIRKILSSLEPRSVESEQPNVSSDDSSDPSEDAAKLIESLLSSIFPGLVSRTQAEPTPSAEKAQPSASDKGKARAVDVEEPRKPAPESDSADNAFANILRHVMELSKSFPTPRSSDEAGPSGTSSSAPAKSTVSGNEQVQIDRAIALSSVEHIQDTLTKLQKDFVLPTELDHYPPSADDRDETASVASASSSDLAKLIPYTKANKPVYKYESELNSLLQELDRIDSHGDAGVREKRKEVVQAVEKALEGVENVIGETVGKRLSLISTSPTATGESLKGFDVAGAVPVETETAVATVPAPSTPVPAEETVVVPTESPSPAGEPLPEIKASVVPESTADLPAEQFVPGSDVEGSTATITPQSIEVSSGTETELTGSRVGADAPETVNTFLSPDKISTPPVQKSQQADNDAEDEVLSFGSDAEKSDWSEVEH